MKKELDNSTREALDSLGTLKVPIGEQLGETPAVETPKVETPAPVVEAAPTVVSETNTVAPVGAPVVTPIVNDQLPNSGHSEFLREILGDRYKTMEEAKQANITSILDETETLRKDKLDLESKLALKPKTNFANDEMAKFNEFVKETGQQNFGLFKKINDADFANMDSMDALVTKAVLDNPNLSGREEEVRKHYQDKYNVNPEEVEDDYLKINQIGVDTDASAAKKALQEIKEKLKIPEPIEEPTAPKVLSPEEQTVLETGWGNVGKNITTYLAKLEIPIANSEKPLLEYDISEVEQQEIVSNIARYALENRMELNEQNVKVIGEMTRNQLLINKLPEIVHATFEKARNMTEIEVRAVYENPSPARNTDTPSPETVKTETEKADQRIEDAFEAAKKRGW